MFDHPLRLAVGSHAAGSGKGCAMNVISWENGDSRITDYPGCAHRVLARLTQIVNDRICTHRGDQDLLCPECSVRVLALAHRTVGTAGASGEQVWAWLAELLDSPEWGVIRHARRPERGAAIRGVADLCRLAAAGDMPPAEVWRKARGAAAADAAAADADAAAADAYAAYAAADAADAAADAADAAAAAAYAAYAADAADAAAAAAYAAAAARLEHAHKAIDAWERITGTSAPEPDEAAVRDAYARMNCLTPKSRRATAGTGCPPSPRGRTPLDVQSE